MARVDDFDAFYHATRRPLLHQTYALTGSVANAAAAVEHAYANAWSHWRKVRRLPDPVAWIRGEAWRTAGSRPTRWGPWRRRRHAESTHAQSGTPHQDQLARLDSLSDGERRVLVLHHLADLPDDRIAQEVGVSESSAASLRERAEQHWDGASARARSALQALEEDLVGVRLSRGPHLRRAGERRHRLHTAAGLVTATVMLVGGGLLIVNDQPGPIEPAAVSGAEAAPPAAEPDARSAAAEASGAAADAAADPAESAPVPEPLPEEFLLDEEALLTSEEMDGVVPDSQGWDVESTTDGTTGNPTYAPCQQEPFADPDGDQSLVRRYTSSARGTNAVQVIEESRSEREAAKAFATMEGWYARCDDDAVQLLSTHAVDELGNEARAFRLRDFGSRDTDVTVGVVRTGPVTTAVVATTTTAAPAPVNEVLKRAGETVARTCLRVSGDCSNSLEVSETSPLPTEEHPGFLAAYDMPKVTGVDEPWVGTEPAPSPRNPGATTCDRARFSAPQNPRSRVFVLPTAREVPRRFGLTQTVGTFASAEAAREFVREANASVQSCPDRDLSASRPAVRRLPSKQQGYVWRFGFEVGESSSVAYRVGLVRDSNRVSLLSVSPADGYDVGPAGFAQLLVRAGQRLDEADRAG